MDLLNLQTNLHALVRAQMRERARRDFAAGKGRSAHGMNQGSECIADYEAEWDRCAQEARRAA